MSQVKLTIIETDTELQIEKKVTTLVIGNSGPQGAAGIIGGINGGSARSTYPVAVPITGGNARTTYGGEG